MPNAICFANIPDSSFANATFASATGVENQVVKRDWDGVRCVRSKYTSANVSQYGGMCVNGNWDLSGSDVFGLDFGAETNPNSYNCGLIVMFCCDVSGFTNYAQMSGRIFNGVFKPARITVPIFKSGLTTFGTMNWAAVRRVEVRIIHVAPAGNSNTFYFYGLFKKLSEKTRVVISYDDGTITQYTAAYQKMKAAGLRGTCYLNSSAIDTAGRMTLAQVAEMYAEGWDMGNHTSNHTPLINSGSLTASGTTATFTAANSGDVLKNTSGTALGIGDEVTLYGAQQPEYNGTFLVASVPAAHKFTYTTPSVPVTPATGKIVMHPGDTYSATNVTAKINECKSWLCSNGFTRSQNHFAYPQGYYYPALSDAVLDNCGVLTARTTEVFGEPFTYQQPVFNGIGAKYEIPTITLSNAQTAAAVLAAIDAAIAKNTSIFIYGHSIVDTPVTASDFATAEFDTLISGIASRVGAGTVLVNTISEFYDFANRLMTSGGFTFGPWSTCDAPLPLSAQITKSHALPIGTGKLTVFPGVATSSQIEEAK